MQWMLDHWFEITTTVLLTIIAINTLDGKWNNSTIVEQLNDLIRSFSSRARREAVLRSDSSSQRHLEISDDGQAQP
jgi:capsule polysaccharide export protein KpsE/RkpR